MALMAAGVGSSTKEPLTIFNKGWVFIIDVIWKKKSLHLTAANFYTATIVLLADPSRTLQVLPHTLL